MPAKTDHEARRREVSAAVWRVLAKHGFGGLTLRAVAAEMGASTGLLTHYFPSKQALVKHALEVAEEHTRARDREKADATGLEALRQALAGVLPLTRELTEINRVWVSSWDASLGDAELGAAERARYRRWRSRLRALVVDAQERGELPDGEPDDLVAGLAAFTHGLVVQALFDPRAFPRRRLLALLDAQLQALATRPGG
jgi:AcrR family transcriptional regulator